MIWPWLFHPGSRWMPNVLISSETGSEYVANYFGTPPADWVYGYLCFEPGAWMWTKGFRRYLHIVKKIIWKFFFKFKQGTCPWMAFAWKFFGIFRNFLRGSVGQIIYREYIVFRGSNISCSLATGMGDRFVLGFARRLWASFPGVKLFCTLHTP